MPTYSQLLQDFKAFDYNGDGIISADEFLGILQRNGENAELDEATAKLMLNSICKHDGGKHDKDGDGQISVEELADALADVAEEAEVPTLREICATFKRDLGISVNSSLKDTIDQAAAKLGVATDGVNLHDVSKLCWTAHKAGAGKV